MPGFFYAFSFAYGADGFEYRSDRPSPGRDRPRGGTVPNRAELVRIHPGFRDAPSVVLHRFGTDADYRVWREWVVGTHGTINFHSSQRNPTALFGAGLIDRIPESIIEAAARRKHPGWPQVKGRVSRAGDGRVGRFGWKAQTASLREFILSAAAVELGLEVPGHAQAGDPRIPPLKAPGFDMNAAECAALTTFVSSLPAPAGVVQANLRDERGVKAGKTLFRTVGCAECHVPQLGEVDGIYSDLLLHAMSPELADTAAYGAFLARADAGAAAPPRPQQPRRGDSAAEEDWRTPPLWGLRDSAPYLHDGRAESIEESILLHGGEAAASAIHFRQLSPRDQAQLRLFLRSL
jgi:CxxC motif-containing protein (DUF1111 family)